MAGLWEPVSGVYWSSAPLLPSMEWLTTLGDSSFFTTVFGALAGAFAGAWAAQRIAGRSKLREELQKEIRNINAGIALALTTANLAMALKKQHVRGMKKSLDDDRERYKLHLQKPDAEKVGSVFRLAPNLQALQELSPPIDTLQDIVFGRTSTAGRALADVAALADAFGGLNHVITKRNELIDKMKEGKLPDDAKTEHLYLGIPYAPGKINDEYGCFVEGMALYTDDAIFYGLQLCKDLQTHGKRMAEKHKENFGGELPSITPIDLKQAESEDLLPKGEVYDKWLSGFQSNEQKTLSWWQRLRRDKQ